VAACCHPAARHRPDPLGPHRGHLRAAPSRAAAHRCRAPAGRARALSGCGTSRQGRHVRAGPFVVPRGAGHRASPRALLVGPTEAPARHPSRGAGHRRDHRGARPRLRARPGPPQAQAAGPGQAGPRTEPPRCRRHQPGKGHRRHGHRRPHRSGPAHCLDQARRGCQAGAGRPATTDHHRRHRWDARGAGWACPLTVTEAHGSRAAEGWACPSSARPRPGAQGPEPAPRSHALVPAPRAQLVGWASLGPAHSKAWPAQPEMGQAEMGRPEMRQAPGPLWPEAPRRRAGPPLGGKWARRPRAPRSRRQPVPAGSAGRPKRAPSGPGVQAQAVLSQERPQARDLPHRLPTCPSAGDRARRRRWRHGYVKTRQQHRGGAHVRVAPTPARRPREGALWPARRHCPARPAERG